MVVRRNIIGGDQRYRIFWFMVRRARLRGVRDGGGLDGPDMSLGRRRVKVGADMDLMVGKRKMIGMGIISKLALLAAFLRNMIIVIKWISYACIRTYVSI